MRINQYEVTIETSPGYEQYKVLLEYYLEKHKVDISAEFLRSERNMMLYGTAHPERLNVGDFING